MFSDEYLDELPIEHEKALLKVIGDVKMRFKDIEVFERADYVDDYLEAYALINALASNIDSLHADEIYTDCGSEEVISNFITYFNEIETRLDQVMVSKKSNDLIKSYKARIGNTFSYEFTDGDICRVQELINELREHLITSTSYENEHQQRLLRRLEKLQSELHKKVADLDRFWGLIGDAGIALGRAGKDAKPIVERIKEITDIIWRTQSRAEELPSDTPMKLMSKEDIE